VTGLPAAVKRAGRPLLRALGLRPPDYRGRVRWGEVAMDNVELHGLVRAVRRLEPPAVCLVEIGSYCGGSTVVIARAAARRNPAATVYAIEPFTFHEARYQRDYESLFDANVTDWNLAGRIVKVKARSHDAVRDWRRPIDFLYVDGDHAYGAVTADIRDWVPLVRPGGLVCFHDYKPEGKEGVRRAVDEHVAPRHERLFLAGSLVCFRKRGGA
jgi:predicted O-methyltransferase YrrM